MIGRIVKSAFAAIGLNFGPHSFRHMQWAIAQDAPPRIALAISLNLGHSSTKVSFEHYGKKTLEERRSLLQGYFQENDIEKQKEIEKALENLTNLIGRSDRRD
jgi:integrase